MENLGCGVRNRNQLENRNNNIGFRVVSSTFFGILPARGRMAEQGPGRTGRKLAFVGSC